MQQRKPVVLLMGPTASGKTALAMELYDRMPTEIISVDSAMIYRGMDIGTAKPDVETLARYPHKLVDIREPDQAYSAAEFRSDVLALIEQAHENGKLPVLTGGTMMYFNALVKGLADLPEADAAIRQQLLEQAEAEGWPAIHARLAEVDPESANRLAPNDSQRLQRALEVYLLTGKPMSWHWAQQQKQQLPYNVLSLAVMPEQRSVLHERIELRFMQMLEQGFIDEVEQVLWQRGDLHLQMPSVRCVGYRQVWEYLAGNYDREMMIHKGIVATRQLAKRQVTWLRSWENLHWLDSLDKKLSDNALKLVESVII